MHEYPPADVTFQAAGADGRLYILLIDHFPNGSFTIPVYEIAVLINRTIRFLCQLFIGLAEDPNGYANRRPKSVQMTQSLR